jgi:hypothetical protein
VGKPFKFLKQMQSQELVKFGSDDLITLTKNGKQYVSVRSVSLALGLNAKWQVDEIKKHNVLKAEVCVGRYQVGGQNRNLTFLNIEFFQGWLFRINPNKVKPQAQAKLEAYQKKCYKVLYDYFLGNHSQLRGTRIDVLKIKQRIAEIDGLIKNLPKHQEYLAERKRLKREIADLEKSELVQLKLDLSTSKTI